MPTIHKLVFYGNQHFEEGHRPIDHSCKMEKEKLKYRTVIKTNILGKPKYRDEKGNKYPDIESFQNRMSLPKIEIQERSKKRKWNIISSRVEGKTIKVRITNKNYQTSNEEEEKGEECREEEHKESQEEVIEIEFLLDITHIFN